MSITMRILQEYDIRHEKEFLELEGRFAALERARPDLPQGKRMKPISAAFPSNTLIWQGQFESLDAARQALELFSGDPTHEELLGRQLTHFKSVKIEFYQDL